jgi:cell division protein FtsB
MPATSYARAPRRGSPPRRARKPKRRVARPGVRWDRVGRVALLLVLGLIVLLYVGPARSYFTTWQEAKHKRAEVQRLERENVRLRARRKALNDPRTLEFEARRLGMVRAGERAFVIQGLPQR